jgi:hypothetical protein
MEKFIKLADIRKLNKQVSLDEISSLRMIEIINEKANEYAKMHVENFKIEQAERLLEIFGKREDIEHIKILVENKNALIETFENKNKELVDIIEKLITDEHIEQSMYNSWIEKAKELIATKTLSK